MNVTAFIYRKRQGSAHTPEELEEFVRGIAAGTIPDYQIAAWLMAVCCRGMTLEETAGFTQLLATSGRMLDLSGITRPKVDKHSTGGVGDKVTLVLGPLVASAGAAVAKLSGRGLGHTGGTIDKLESIPGFQGSLSTEAFIRQVQEIGIAIVGQTQDLAPVDGRLYALRDVTATIDSVPLIAASVLSKKIAAGADVILIDVKYGSGAFMKDLESARELARTMVEVGKRLGKSISVAISGMEQPLGRAVGNALEVVEAIQTLRGNGPEDLTALCLQLGAVLLHQAGLAADKDTARAVLQDNIASGKALVSLRQLIEAQGGDPTVIDHPDALTKARFQVPVTTSETGFLGTLDALMVGEAVRLLGGGRSQKGETIDYEVGVVLERKVGDPVAAGDALAMVHANHPAKAEAACRQIASAYRTVPAAPPPVPLIQDVLIGS